MKRMIALVLSLVMALSLCAPAWGAEGSAGELPVASVEPYTPNEEIEWGNFGQWSPTPGLEANLEAIYKFACTETADEAAVSPYANWYCDFYVKLDKDLGANQIFLGGNYGDFGWIGFHNGDVTLNANEELPLLGSVTSNPWTYANIASFVGEFICGVGDVNNALADAKFTVMLRLTNPEDTSEFYDVATIEHTFKYAAEVDGVKYKTLQAAVNAGGTVKLLDDVALGSETVTVAKDVILDLAGYTVSGTCNASQAHLFMVNNGVTMTVKDSSAAGAGKITYAAGSSNVGWTIDVEGNLVLESGTIELTGSWSIGYAVDVRPNAWGTGYTVPTTFTMNGGKVVSSDGAIRVASSSAGSYKDVSANFIMNGGEIDAGFDGLFIQQSDAVYDVLNVTVKSGKISSDLYTVRFYGDAAATGVVNGSEKPMTISLEGGEFSSADAGNLIVFGGGKLSRNYMDFAISGGYFTEDPSAYCAEGLTGVASDKAGYLYMVGEKGVEKPAEVVVAAPEAKDEIEKELTLTEEKIVDDLKAADAVEISTDALTAKATDIANNTSAEADGEQVAALGDATNSNVNSEDVTIVVQPFFDITVTDVEVEENSNNEVKSASITLDITPKYQTVATTADVANEEEIILPEDEGTTNAVVVDKGKLEITEPVVITVKIPDALAELAVDGVLYVTHKTSNGKTYVYEATVAGAAGNYTATFTNPHGFSTFIFSAKNNIAASISNDNYTSLQDAINNAGKGATIVVKKADQTAMVKRVITFTVEFESEAIKANTTITKGSGYSWKVTDNDDGSVTYVVKRISSGTTSTTPDKLVESAKTADPIGLYFGVTALATLGSALLLKKKED